MLRPAAGTARGPRRRHGRHIAASAVLGAGVALAALACSAEPDASPSTTDATADAGPGASGPRGTDDPTGTTGVASLGWPERAAVIAHRGASAEAPEHTFAAYDLAMAQGADYLEHDLQRTADGQLVVLHDDVLDRTARGPAASCTGTVRTKTAAQLQDCEVGSWFDEAHPELADPSHADQRIPTMRQVLERYGEDARFYIETKAPEAQPGMEEALVALLDEFGLADDGTGRVVIQSFSPDSLRAIHALRPNLPLVLLVSATGPPIDDALLDDASTFATGIGPAATLVNGAVLTEASERCLLVHPYTVDDPLEMQRLLDLGVHGLFTNRPATMADQLDAHPGGDRPCA